MAVLYPTEGGLALDEVPLEKEEIDDCLPKLIEAGLIIQEGNRIYYTKSAARIIGALNYLRQYLGERGLKAA